MILATAYLGNIQYYTKLCSGNAVIDLHENYQKQSFRNRCIILTPNGTYPLIVPVLKPFNIKVLSGDIRIDPTKKWQHQHWNAIVSSYRKAPFFDHYQEKIAPFYTTRYERLAEWNNDLQQLILELIHLKSDIQFAPTYLQTIDSDDDYRSTLSPKTKHGRSDPDFHPDPYYQVFSDRFPFQPNLSILDLLFCEGPGSTEILKKSARIAIE